MTDQTITLSSGLKLGFAEYGDPKGVPLFFYHGWPSSRTQGELLHDIGRDFNLRIISPDRPGLGLSDFQPDRKLLDWPPVLDELARHLGVEKFHVLGISGGGPYVLATAHSMPERVLSATVVCGAPPLREVGTSELMWTYKLALWTQRRTPILLAPGLALSAKVLGLPMNSLPMRAFVSTLGPRDQEALHDVHNARIIMSSGKTGLESGHRAMTLDGNIYNSDWGIELEKVTYPIRYWHGSLDLNIPASLVQKFTSRIPNAKLVIMEGEGHYSLPALRIREMLSEQLGMQGRSPEITAEAEG
ncbi:alpha/beta fold hydrolase [Roseimicrobium gellanilyticum]|nr:alpha/beta hydrolase [Roseimicrobium gellanilyticum]